MNKESLSSLFNEDIFVISEASDNQKISIKGKNRKGLLVLVDDPSSEFLPGDLDELLQKILTSIEMTYEDIVLINVQSNNLTEIPVPFSSIINFGVDRIPGISPDMSKYKIVKEDGYQLINVDSLEQISENENLKKQLWSCLQKAFLNRP